jgi:hypothetical protein
MTDLAPRIGDIARRLLGTPNAKLSTKAQLRFGTNGSIAVEIGGAKAGTWFDHENEIGGGAWELLCIKGNMANGEAVDWLRSELNIDIGGGEEAAGHKRIVATYDYRAETGALLYQAVRYEPKGFKQRRPDDRGGWIWKLGDVPRALYRLPELLAAPDRVVFVPEGEKDVDRLRSLGLLATCNSEGAGKWRPDFAKFFAGRHVVVLPDYDDPGRQHADQVIANILPYAKQVRRLELPGLPLKGDVSDWLDAGGTRDELQRLVEAAPVIERAKAETPLELVRFDDMRPRLGDSYLIKHLLGSAGMTVLYGESGSGKTFLALYLSLCLAAEFLFFGRRVRQAGVVYIAAEAGRSIENRIAAAKSEIEFPEIMAFAAIESPVDLCSNDADLNKLIATSAVADLGLPVGLIVIDTLSRVMAGGNENAPEDMGALVQNIDRLRAETGAAVLLVHHSGKDTSKGARGHSLLRAASDTEIEVTRDSGSKVATARVTKQRDYATDGTMSFTLRQVEIGVDSDGSSVTSCVVEEAEATAAGASAAAKPRLPAAQQRALQLLGKAIDEAGEVPPASNHIPASARCVTEDLWRRYCYQGGISSGEGDANKKAFKRAAEALVALGRVGKWEPYVWLS